MLDYRLCNLDVLGDEYQVFFECVKPDIVTLRQWCIPEYYLQSPNMFELIMKLIKSSDSVKKNRETYFVVH